MRPGRLESWPLGAWPHLGLGLGFGLCTFSPSNGEGPRAWAYGRGDACLVWGLMGRCLPGVGVCLVRLTACNFPSPPYSVPLSGALQSP